jgi:hypothetical protein
MIINELPNSAAAAKRLLKADWDASVENHRNKNYSARSEGLPAYSMTYRNPFTGEYFTFNATSLTKGGHVYVSRGPIIYEAHSFKTTYYFCDHGQCMKMYTTVRNRQSACFRVVTTYDGKFIELFREFVAYCVKPTSALAEMRFAASVAGEQLEEGVQLKDH